MVSAFSTGFSFGFEGRSPASIIHAAGHGLVAGDAIRFLSIEPPHAGVDDTVIYYVLAEGLVADDFQFSTSPGGPGFTLDADITNGTITRADSYSEVADGIMDPPTALVTPDSPSIGSALINGVVRVTVTLA